MTIGSNKLRGYSYQHAEHSKSENYPFEAAMLTMTDDSQALRRNVSHWFDQGGKSASETAFQTLLSDANRELASLLQDVRTVQDGPPLDDLQGGRINHLLLRAVQCAAKQYMLQTELGNLALTDELTGLCNRRGFIAIAERQLKIGRRTGRGVLLFFIDVDGLKQINDSFGHSEGDRALKRTAKALKMTFRDSDVIARLGGDEFAVLAVEASDNSEAAIKNRLTQDLKSLTAGETRYALSISLGSARFDARGNTSIEELMVRADRAMYEQKGRRSKYLLDSMTALQPK